MTTKEKGGHQLRSEEGVGSIMPASPRDPIVLLVQRNDDLDMYAEFLSHKGLTPLGASTAVDALAAAPRADIIVTGILLDGEMNGIDLVTRLRADERTRQKPLIVLTAAVSRAQRERARQAGCDLFVPKPCLPEDLLRYVRLLLASSKRHHKRHAAKAHLFNTAAHRPKRQRNRSA